MKNISLLFMTLSLFFVGCSQASYTQNKNHEESETGAEKVMENKKQQWQQVTVKYFDFEGGFYGLVGKDGKKLLPMNLVKEYQVDGSILKVKGHVIKGMMTIQQWGNPFKISDVELIKLGKKDLGQTF